MKEIKHPPCKADCDFCKNPAEYDAPTNQGPWAYLCKDCFKIHTGRLAQACGYHFKKEEK